MIKKYAGNGLHLSYLQKGESPKLLIHSGTHGDEHESVPLIIKLLEKNKNKLPDFIFVPHVSPSAMDAKTRKNKNGNDLNRVFSDKSEDEEVVANIEIIKNYSFDLYVTFHEDPEQDQFYLYDCGYVRDKKDMLDLFFKKLDSASIKLLDGFDDPDDPELNYEFSGGYKFFPHAKNSQDNGMSSTWVLNKNIAPRCLIPEVPGLVEVETKQKILEIFFNEVLLNYFK